MTQPSSYALAPLFALRMTGFSVERLEALCAPELSAAVDAVLRSGADLKDASSKLCAALLALPPVAREQSKVRKKLHARAERLEPLEGFADAAVSAQMQAYESARSAHAAADETVSALFESELPKLRALLHQQASDDKFRQALLLSAPEFESRIHESAAPGPRNHVERQRELTWISYLQRFTTKNETISFFGPTTWGTFDETLNEPARIELSDPAIEERTVYLERWACQNIADELARDEEATALLPVTLNDDVDYDGERVQRRGAEPVIVSRELWAKLAAGSANQDEAKQLIDAGFAKRRYVVPHSARPLELLRRLVSSWPAGAARERWSQTLSGLSGRCDAVARANGLGDRRRAIEALRAALQALNTDQNPAAQALYVSRLPFNEDCKRATSTVRVGRPVVEQATSDLAPWYELWRDLAALYRQRIFEQLMPVWQSASRNGRVRLSAFLDAAAAASMPLGKTGGTGFARELAGEIHQAWTEQLGDRAHQPEVTLTADDLSFIRRRFKFERMTGYDWPAPDFQISAKKTPGGDAPWELVLAEIHPDFSPWEHCIFVWCHDKDAFLRAYQHEGHPRALEVAPWAAHHKTAHVHSHAAELAGNWTATTNVRTDGVPALHPADLEVTLAGNDFVVSHAGQQLGSLLNTWAVTANTHQLELLPTGAHSPRLRVGRVIVQRRSWLVPSDHEALGEDVWGEPAMRWARGLRYKHALPETVFVRPVMAVRMTHHKDAKPIFLDFRSPFLCELFASIGKRYSRLRIVEMLPAPEDCWLRDAEGRYSFELRCAIVPSARGRMG